MKSHALQAGLCVLLVVVGWLFSPGAQAQTPLRCDVDTNGVIDRIDIRLINIFRGQRATGPTDPRDVNGDGRITVLDSRTCTNRCTFARCNTRPIADAGDDQVAVATQLVTLDGSGSSDFDGNPLTFRWSYVSRPTGSLAALSSTTVVRPTFRPDIGGRYVLQLIVRDGTLDSVADQVIIDAAGGNLAPVANAGFDQTVAIPSTVQLDGSASSDPNGDPVTFAWRIQSAPAGSLAGLTGATTFNPVLRPDVPGLYVVELLVRDATLTSTPDTVVINAINTAPVADAGNDRTAARGTIVTLDGNGSSDADGNPLAFQWTFVSVPAGSAATLVNPTTAAPRFTADRLGDYVVQLIVNDGIVESTPDTVLITTANTRPVAAAGADVTTRVQSAITLDGSGSSDANGDPLVFEWALISRPPGSAAQFDLATSPRPAFRPDFAGNYIAQLVVNDGLLDSDPDTVVINATNTAPTARAGIDQSGPAGPFQLDGSGSTDPEPGTPLTYAWTVTAGPAGAVFSSATAASPVVTLAQAGTYTVQLIVNDGELSSPPDTMQIVVSGVPSLSIADVSLPEGGGAGVSTVDLTISLSAPAADTVTVAFSTADGTATNGADYLATAGTASIPAGQTQTTVRIYRTVDNLYERDESYFVNLSEPVNAILGDPQGRITLLNDDDSPIVTVSPGGVTEGNTGTAQMVFTVGLDRPSGVPATISYATENGSAVSPSDFIATAGTVTIPAGEYVRTVVVTVNGDTQAESNESFRLNIASPVDARITGNPFNGGTIFDDDSALPRLTIGDVVVTEGNSGLATVNFPLTLSAPSATSVTVSFQTVQGTASNDYLQNSGAAVFAAGQTAAVIPVQVGGDTTFERDETFTVQLVVVTGAVVADASATGTIRNDDAAPGFSINDGSIAEGSNGSVTPFTFSQIVLSAPSGLPATVTYSTADGSATTPEDYAPVSGVITIPAGQTAAFLPLNRVGDTVGEGNETFLVVLSSPDGATLADDRGIITIIDDETALAPAISIADASIVEGNAGLSLLNFTITLSRTSPQNVSFLYSTEPGTAQTDVDYTRTTGTAVIPAGQTSIVLPVPVRADLLAETDETFFLNLNTPSNATLLDAQATGTIINDDLLPTLSMADTTVVEGMSGTRVLRFTAQLSGVAAVEVSADYVTADGSGVTQNSTARAGSDYAATSGRLVIPAGAQSTFVDIVVSGDTVHENNEYLFLDISNPVNALLNDARAVGEINNDDAPPILSVADAAVVEGNSGSRAMSFTVSLAGESDLAAIVTYATVNGTAVAGVDYVAANGTVTLAGGVSEATIVVNVIGDTVEEQNETLVLDIISAQFAQLPDSEAIGTILDDDAVVPVASIGNVVVQEGNAGTTQAVLQVVLSQVTSSPVTIAYATEAGTAVAGSDFTAASGTVTFAAGTAGPQNIAVDVTGDTLYEDDESFSVVLSSPVNATLLPASSRGDARIVNDDAAPLLSVADVSIAEGSPGAGADEFVATITLNVVSPVAISVTYQTVNGSALAPGDYAAANETATIPAGQLSVTIPLSRVRDSLYERDENFAVRLLSATGAVIQDPEGIITLLNDDAPPAITLADASVIEGASGQVDLVFTATLSTLSAVDVAADYSTGDLTATAGTDYVAATGRLSIPAGQTTASITIRVIGDEVIEATETLSLTLTAPADATLADGLATGSILTDDTNAPPISVAGGPSTALDIDSIQLIGSGSFDPNGDPLTYLWSVESRPALSTVGFSSQTVANPAVQVSAAGTYVFRLTVNDGIQTNGAVANGQNQPLVTVVIERAPRLSIDSLVVTEGDNGTTAATFTVSLQLASGPIDRPINVAYATGNGTATAGSDFVATSGTLNFPANVSTPLTIVVPVVGDTVFENTETFNVNLSSPVNAAIAVGSGTATIEDNDPDPARTLALSPSPLAIRTFSQGTLTVTLGAPAGAGGVTVNLASSVPASVAVPASVVLPLGATSATVPVTSTAVTGIFTISASGANLFGATASVEVQNRQATVSATSTLIGVGRQVSGTITLAEPAPEGGVSFSLVSSSPATAAVSPATFNFSQGQTQRTFTISGVSLGGAVLSAAATGYTASPANVTVTGELISIGGDLTLGPGQTSSLPLSLTAPAPIDVVIALATSDPSIATITPTITIPSGQSAPIANPQVSGVGIGTVTITATPQGAAAAVYAPDTRSATVTLALDLAPATVNLAAGRSVTATLTLSSPAPAGGLAVALASDTPATAAPASTSVVVPQGQTQLVFTVNGVAAGTTTIRASAPGVTGDSLGVTVRPPPRLLVCTTGNGGCGQGTGGTIRVGEDLQQRISVYLEEAAPSPVTVSATAASGAIVLVSTSEVAAGTAVGNIPNVTTVNQGTGPSFWIQGLQQGAATTVTLSAQGYADAVLTVEVDPSGFAWISGNFTTNTSAPNTSLTAQAVRLTRTTLLYQEAQEVRGGIAPVVVTIANSIPAAGNLNPNPLTVAAVADNAVGTYALQFDPTGGGIAELRLTPPAGFDDPAANGSFDEIIQATVNAPRLLVCTTGAGGCGQGTGGTIRVGEDLQQRISIYLEEGPPTPVTVTATLASGLVSLVSTSEVAAGGAVASVGNVTSVNAGSGPSFWIQGLQQGLGTTLTLSAPGYTENVLNIEVDPSGFTWNNADFTTNTSAANTTLTFRPVRLSRVALTFADAQEVRGGLAPVSVAIANSIPSTGTLIPNPVSVVAIADNTNALSSVQFDPSGGGIAELRLTPPAGFDDPAANGSFDEIIQATVNAPRLLVCTNGGGGCGQATGATIRVGEDLQQRITVYLEAAPPSPVTVTATSASGAVAVISTSEVTAGGTVANVANVTSVNAGSGPSFWLQGLQQGLGTTLTLSAPGYTPAVLNVEVDPSGFVWNSGDFTTNTSAANTALTFRSARLVRTTLAFIEAQEVRGGLAPVNVTIENSIPSTGALIPNPVAVVAIADNQVALSNLQFDPTGGGIAELRLTPPAGFDDPAANGPFDEIIQATVNAPRILVCTTGGGGCGQGTGTTIRVGEDLQQRIGVYLEAAPPAPLTMTATSAAGAVAIVSTSEVTAGSTAASIAGVSPGSSGAAVFFWIQGLQQNAATTVTFSAPGYTDAVLTVEVDPSGFVWNSANFTTNTAAANTTLSFRSARLARTTLAFADAQEVRGGLAPVSVGITNSVPSTGTLIPNPVNVVAVADNAESLSNLQFDPAGAGIADLRLTPPAGFDDPAVTGSADEILQATVNLPRVLLCTAGAGAGCGVSTSTLRVGEDLQLEIGVYLEIAPVAPLTMAVSSTNGTAAILSTAEGTIGTMAPSLANFSAATTGTSVPLWVQGLLQGGGTTLTFAAPGYESATLVVEVDPSGFISSTADFSIAATATDRAIILYAARLSRTTLAYAGQQEVRGGLASVAVTVTSSDPAVGTITTSPVFVQTVLDGVDNSEAARTNFNPALAGQTTLTVGTPPGWDVPATGVTNDRFVAITVTP